MAAASGRKLARAGTDAAHLAQVAAAPVEDHHAVVAVAVRDVHAAAFSRYGVRVWIHGNVRRTMQERAAEALGRRVPGANAVSRVTEELRPDLQQQVAVVAVLLDHTISIAADPDIVFVIDETAMGAVRQNRVLASVRLSGRNQRRITPGAHHIAFGVELDHRRRSLGLERAPESTGLRVCSANAFRGNEAACLEAAGDDEQVILRVDAGPAGF